MLRPRITKKARVNAVTSNLRRRRPRRKRPVVVLPQRARRPGRNRQRRRNGGGPLGLNKKQLGTNLLMGLGTAIGGPMMRIFRPVVEAGVDFLSTYSTGSSDNGLGTAGVPGQIIVTYTVAPRGLSNTRLNKMSELYQRYIFNHVTIRYMPAVAVTQNGQLIGYFDTDPEDVPPGLTGLANINYANAHGGKLFQISEPCSFEMPVIKDRTYYTDYDAAAAFDEERFKIQAVFRVLQVTVLPVTTALGSFAIDYGIEFDLPQVVSNDIISSDSASFHGLNASSISQPNYASQTNSWLFQSCLAGGVGLTIGQMPSYSSAQGQLWQYFGNSVGTTQNGITFSSDEAVGPVYWEGPGYYTLCFTMHNSTSNVTIINNSATTIFHNSPSSGYVSTGISHYTNSASSDAFIILDFQVDGTWSQSNQIVFDPHITTTSTAVLGDFSLSVLFNQSAFSDNHHSGSKLAQKISAMQSQIDSLTINFHRDTLLNGAFEAHSLNETVKPVGSQVGSVSPLDRCYELDQYLDSNDDFEGVYTPAANKFTVVSKKRKS